MDPTNTLNPNQQPNPDPGTTPLVPPVSPFNQPVTDPPAEVPTPMPDPVAPIGLPAELPVTNPPATPAPVADNLPAATPMTDLNSSVGAFAPPLASPAPTFSYPQPSVTAVPPADSSTPGVLNLENPTPPSEALDLSNPNVPVFATSSTSSDPVPTDLSHLIGGTTPPLSAEPAPVPAEASQVVQPTMVVGGTESTAASGSHSFPKKIVLGAIVILLLVTGASAYFILGVGQTEVADETTSVPAEQQLTVPPSAVIPTVPATPQATSSGFGAVSGATPSGTTATPTATSGASAIDRLKSR
ncbi:MAG: hypothetical protein Q7S88_03315 [Candidatus Daviesbacteria bacterium]|nr:hypothetical protein [Candidatus Daviesbacteria bacterium]